MKYKILFFLFLMYCVGAQTNYVFNYYTIYEYHADEKDDKNRKELTFSNSKDNSYHLLINISNDSIITNSRLIDVKNEVSYKYEDFVISKINTIAQLKGKLSNATKTKINFSLCKNKDKSHFYEIDSSKNVINIKQYKNFKKHKLINESIFEIEKSEICKNNFWNFNIFLFPLSCDKFVLNNNGIIISSYFLEKNKKRHFRKLIEIKETDFTIAINNP